jgi:CheY-like chemotaxis protein
VATVRLIHWNESEGRERKRRLASLGHHVEFDHVDGPGLSRVLRSSFPDAYVIDLSRSPSNGRMTAMWLRTTKSTRHIPIVFVDGDPEKVKKLKELLPDATYTTWPRLKTELPKAIARPTDNLVVPPSHIYTGRSVVDKLGVKQDMRVCMSNAPKGFVETLQPLPTGVRFTAKATPQCDLFVAFIRSRRELATHLESLTRDISRQTLWVVWPKKTSGIKTDVDGNAVRESGLASGWVDFKVCAIDDTWSGLAFKRRKDR